MMRLLIIWKLKIIIIIIIKIYYMIIWILKKKIQNYMKWKIFDLNIVKYDEEYLKNDNLSTNYLTENENFKNSEEYFNNFNI